MFYRTQLTGTNLSLTNTLENPNAVIPMNVNIEEGDNNIYNILLEKASWNVIRFKVK